MSSLLSKRVDSCILGNSYPHIKKIFLNCDLPSPIIRNNKQTVVEYILHMLAILCFRYTSAAQGIFFGSGSEVTPDGAQKTICKPRNQTNICDIYLSKLLLRTHNIILCNKINKNKKQNILTFIIYTLYE